MLNLKKVAITGGLSCGKSAVTKIFNKLGAQVIDSDEIVHRLLSPETELGKQVIKLIGPDVVVNNQIDRAKIAAKVFTEPRLLEELEKITHPAIRQEILQTLRRAEANKQSGIVAVEIPLLFEAGFEQDFNYTIAVIADPKIARKRFIKKTGYQKTDYDQRMKRQLSIDEKAQRANFIIENNGSIEELTNKVEIVFKEINQSI